MEDILASIRRIIADDQVQSQRSGYGTQRRVGAAPPEPRAAEPALRGGYDDVLDLARMRANAERDTPRLTAERHDQTPPASAAPAHVNPPAAHSSWAPDSRLRPPVEPRYDEPAAEDHHDQDEADVPGEQETYDEALPGRPVDRYDAEHTGGALATGTIGTGDALISAKPGASVMSAFETLAATVILQNGDMLERIMRDQLRPMIKSWLDDNLPTLVERLVRAEIERVARGGRS